MKYFSHPSFRFRLSVYILLLYVFIAIFAPIIANHEPIACPSDQGLTFPIFDRKIWTTNTSACILPIIPYGPQKTNVSEYISLSPLGDQANLSFRYRHWLGTDKLGRDVASGMIHGTKVALQIGFISVLLSFLLGVSIGMLSAYFKDEGLYMNIFQWLVLIFSTFLVLFYLSFEWLSTGFSLVSLCIALLCFVTIQYLSKWGTSSMKNSYNYRFPVDTVIIKIIEIRKSFPGVFLLLALTSLFAIPSIWNIIFIITILSWTEFARYARAETLAIKEETYITTAQVLGYHHFRVLYHHILPNILPTLIVVACFSVSGAILLESTLSFLGIGLPVEQVTWGKMMAEGRSMMYWWMVVFPGMALFIIILCLNTIADTMSYNDSVK